MKTSEKHEQLQSNLYNMYGAGVIMSRDEELRSLFEFAGMKHEQVLELMLGAFVAGWDEDVEWLEKQTKVMDRTMEDVLCYERLVEYEDGD